jgi:hypothetical protein
MPLFEVRRSAAEQPAAIGKADDTYRDFQASRIRHEMQAGTRRQRTPRRSETYERPHQEACGAVFICISGWRLRARVTGNARQSGEPGDRRPCKPGFLDDLAFALRRCRQSAASAPRNRSLTRISRVIALHDRGDPFYCSESR